MKSSKRLHLDENLSDDLSSTLEGVPVHDWQKAELDRRKEKLQRNPGSTLTWDKVKKRVRNRHGG